MANVSSNERGREVLLQKDYIMDKIYPFMFHKNKFRRVGVLKTLRNMSFEYEKKDVEQFLANKENDIIDKINRYLLSVLKNAKFNQSAYD